MNTNAPLIPQEPGEQPKMHTFIGDTPMVPDQADAKIAETSYGAVRAYQHTVGQASPYGTDSADDESFDIRKASPRAQARWLAADESLTY